MGLSAASKQVLDPNSTPNPDWYSGLKKPKWNPPGWIFPIMWLIISKPTQFIAVSKLLATQSKNGVHYPNLPVLAYCTHLALGDAWNKGKSVASLHKQNKQCILILLTYSFSIDLHGTNKSSLDCNVLDVVLQ